MQVARDHQDSKEAEEAQRQRDIQDKKVAAAVERCRKAEDAKAQKAVENQLLQEAEQDAAERKKQQIATEK